MKRLILNCFAVGRSSFAEAYVKRILNGEWLISFINLFCAWHNWMWFCGRPSLMHILVSLL